MRWHSLLILLGGILLVVAVSGSSAQSQHPQQCESCRSSEFCHDGLCSVASCDRETRWYLTESTGIITDGPGNYSAHMKCTWLIDARTRNSSTSRAKIKLRIDNFATECAWDHLYIWDGDSTRDKLVASLSGVIQDTTNVFEISAESGAAYIHFYSDAAFTMPGFNISYEVQGCDQDCMSKASHGACVTLASNGGSKQCICDSGWTGPACALPTGCPATYLCQNGGNCSENVCVCESGFRGPDCSSSASEGMWENAINPALTYWNSLPAPSASHATVLVNQSVFWVGGETFRSAEESAVMDRLAKLDLASMEFETIRSSSQGNPHGRFAHSVVVYNDSLYMYGGVVNGTTIVSEVWQWHLSHNLWLPRKYVKEGREGRLGSPPIPAAGHTAHIVNNKMLIIFGYGGPEYGFINTIQELDFRQKKWSFVPTGGAFVYGTYGHASVHDPRSGLIYIYGGYTQSSIRQYILSSRMLVYDPSKSLFKKLKDAPVPRFLHSGALMERTILFFGGNPHNESVSSRGAPCYAGDFYSYDIECDTWSFLKAPSIPYSRVRLPRYGHSSLVFKEQMYIFGGFQGILLNDVIRYIPGQCRHFQTRDSCLGSVKLGRRCAWSERTKQCLHSTSLMAGLEFVKCPRSSESDDAYCNEHVSCHDCLSNGGKCQWCKEGNKCSSSTCKNNSGAVAELGLCPKEATSACGVYLNCMACISLSNDTCVWRRDEGHGGTCAAKNPGPPTDIMETTAALCDIQCNARTSCDSCSTQAGTCMWCANEEKCIDSSAYLAVFPYGQCRDWQAMNRRCAKVSKCEDFKSCSHCMDNPDCGWCDDGSATGLGHCFTGASRGPRIADACPAQRWFFVNCPSCNCNGHSRCTNGTSVCQHCGDFTEGEHCDRCMPDRFGDPRNGGNCTQCQCPLNSHGCDPENGNCKCTTKGTVGRHCDKCDETNHYSPHVGTCFYELPVGYQFTFNLTKPEDLHLTGINFKTIPSEKEFDVKFTLLCSNDSLVNISFKTAHMLHEEAIWTDFRCGLDKKIEHLFQHDQLPFGQDGMNTTLFVYVYQFRAPSVIVISFAQHASLDLLHFFVVFACCFLSLLLLAAVLWKFKQKYDIYRRRQRMLVEMEQMAKRPFACVHMEMPHTPARRSDKERHGAAGAKKRSVKPGISRPCFVATEPLADNRHAVMSALICLPTGAGPGDGKHYTPSGQTGLILGSTLVLYGSQTRKPSVDNSHKTACDKLKKHQTADSEL
ncbi:Attractin [Hypsibius exemplaris]|uniref:Attractin n=1 Tax=Hypsibius exemplaris TaxID=2072580 RepID=A0A1W0WSJ0_HYPEX|nr:Attractin [Hypsibius exemplaris]